MVFRQEGVSAFQAALNKAIRDPASLRRWYHDILNHLTDSLRVDTVLIRGLWWQEIDTPEDLAEARAYFTAHQHNNGHTWLSPA